MIPTAKLTKRQKKGIAFRERNHGKSKYSPLNIVGNLEDETDVHSFEHQVPVDAAQGQQGHQVSAETLVARGKAGAKAEEGEERMVVAAKKRKRKVGKEEKGAPGKSDKPKPKRREWSAGGPVVGMEQSVEERVGAGETESENESERTRQRFILFLGNLKYTTTPEAIQAHFSVCVPPPTVRLLTPKPPTKSLTKPVTKSKGCAFLEFKHRNALQQGLRLHHSKLDGRQVNVELTAGGGGKGLTRMKKLKERNRELEGQRWKRQDPRVSAQSSGTQRFSATSGMEQTPTHKRTWTTGDIEETKIHRGGQKYQKDSKRRRSLDFGTGMNAIPIG